MVEWNKKEKKLLEKLNTPEKIQDFIDSLGYDSGYECRSPRYVLKEGKAHCFEGAILAAAILEYHNEEPLLLDLVAVNDDDHVVAPFTRNNHWGAIAKSNTTALRYREPVYKNLRELVMSYFDVYFNTLGEKTLRSYSKTFNLKKYNSSNWRTTPEDLEFVEEGLLKTRHYELLTPKMIRELSKASPTIMKAVFLGSSTEGLYDPKKKS